MGLFAIGKFSLLFSFLTVGVLVFSGSVSLAVRFQSEDDGGVRRIMYPEAVKNVVHRGEELKSLARKSHLAAVFPYLELTDLVKGQKQPGSGSSAVVRFLNESAELIVAQSPEELQMSLRRMYFYGDSVIESGSLWKDSNGSRYVRGQLLSGSAFQVEVVPGLENSPALMKIHRIIAMIEIGQAHIARAENRHADYRLYFPVLDMLNKIVSGLFVEEVLKKMGTEAIRQEIATVDTTESVKESLATDFLGRGYMHSKSMSWIMENFELRGPQLVEWVRDIREQRTLRARQITGLSKYAQQLETLIRGLLSAMPATEYFNLARLAKASGDEKTFRIARELMVTNGSGSGGGPSRGPSIGPAPGGPSCERSFVQN